MPLFEIKSCYDARVLFSRECASFKICVEAAVTDGASLVGASLVGAGDIVQAGQPDSWGAYGYRAGSDIRVQIGCRNKTLAQGRAYWANKTDRREVLAALDYIEAVAKIRGWGGV